MEINIALVVAENATLSIGDTLSAPEKVYLDQSGRPSPGLRMYRLDLLMDGASLDSNQEWSLQISYNAPRYAEVVSYAQELLEQSRYWSPGSALLESAIEDSRLLLFVEHPELVDQDTESQGE